MTIKDDTQFPGWGKQTNPEEGEGRVLCEGLFWTRQVYGILKQHPGTTSSGQ